MASATTTASVSAASASNSFSTPTSACTSSLKDLIGRKEKLEKDMLALADALEPTKGQVRGESYTSHMQVKFFASRILN